MLTNTICQKKVPWIGVLFRPLLYLWGLGIPWLEKVYWLIGFLVLGFVGFLVSWFLGFCFLVDLWLPGFTVSWHIGFKVVWFLAFEISKFQRFTDPIFSTFHFMVFNRYWSHIKDFEDVSRRIVGMFRLPSFPTCSKFWISKILRCIKLIILFKNDLPFSWIF